MVQTKTKTKTLIGVALVTLAAGSLAAGLFTLQRINKSKNKAPISCTRTGDIKDIYTQGYISGVDEQKNNFKYEDECDSSSNKVIKYFCAENKSNLPRSKVSSNSITCEGGCKDGACVQKCESPLVNCDGDCVNLISNSNHCGQCEVKCSGGSCKNGTCTGKKIICDQRSTACSGKCANTSTDASNCGACGKKCGSGSTCINGICKSKCDSGKIYCNNACVDSQKDTNNCGACGNSCGAGEICSNGTCKQGITSCSGKVCNNTCVNVKTDSKNCGDCGKVCASGTTCKSGICTR